VRYLVLVVAACGGGNGASKPTIDAGVTVDVAPPMATCTEPGLADVSSPTATVGDGTAGSCTNAALQTAATAGGTIVFNCGASPVTIPITQTVTFTTETVLDGGGTHHYRLWIASNNAWCVLSSTPSTFAV